jgi:MFS family permease
VAVWFVALAPFVSGFFGGLTVTAFWQLLSKVVRTERRSSVLAWRSLIATSCGFGAGYVIAGVLATHPGPKGYAILFLIQFGVLVLSFLAFACIRELPHAVPPPRPGAGLGSNLRAVPTLLRTDRILSRYIAARLCALGTLVVSPFLAIHAREVLDAPKEFLGALVSAQMLGAVTGNVLGAYLGDRHGGRLLVLLSTGGGVVLCVFAAFNPWAWGFHAVFFLLGACSFLQMNGTSTLMLELFAGDRRPTYLSIVSALTLPGVLGAALLATILRDHVPAFWPAALLAAGLNLAAHHLFRSLPEPRQGMQ